MSESEIKKAKLQADQSHAELERALEHLKEAVDERAEQIGAQKERLDTMLENKKQVAQDFVDTRFKEAESFLDKQSGMIHDALTDTKGQADLFLKEMSDSIDGFIQDVQKSMSKTLDFVDDRRLTTWVSVFFAGCLFGALITRRRALRAATPQVSEDTGQLNKDNLKKIA